MQHGKGGTYFADFELWKEFHLLKVGIFSLRRLLATKGDIDVKSGPNHSIFIIRKSKQNGHFLVDFFGAERVPIGLLLKISQSVRHQ